MDKGILVPPNKEDVHTLYLGDWQDGCNALSWATLCFQVGVLCVPPLFKNETKFAQVTELVPIAIGFCPEITDNVVQLREYIAPMIKRLLPHFNYNGFKFKFCLRKAKADFPMLSKIFGCNSSGYCKCPFCHISFKQKGKLFNFTHYHKCKKRSLLSNAALVADQPEQAQRRGLKSKNGLLSGSKPVDGDRPLGPLEQLEDAGLTDYEPSIDALHTIKGAAAAFIDAEKNHKNSQNKRTWDSNEFARRLMNEVGRDSLAKCKGVDYRMLFVKYEKVILPSITDINRRTDVAEFCHLWTEIQYIMYAPPSAQQITAFRLHLHVAIFKSMKLAQKLWGNEVMNLYLHTLSAHVGSEYEKMDFRNTNCEQGEASFALLKKMLLASCRRQYQVLEDICKRLHYQRYVQFEYGRKKRKPTTEAEIEKRIQQSRMEGSRCC
jgi:hypothetical protein